jgi:hypothetical protein
MRWNHAWLSCQSVFGPPFGGITRIRFKGSPAHSREPCWTLSHCGSPALSFSLRIRPTRAKSTTSKIAGRGYGRSTNPQCNCDSGAKRFGNVVSRQAAIGLLPALCWCGKWPSTSHSPVSKRFRHYRYRTYPCHRRCLRFSPCTSRRRHLFHRRTCHNR